MQPTTTTINQSTQSTTTHNNTRPLSLYLSLSLSLSIQSLDQQPVTPQPQVVQSSGGPDLTMDNLQTSKFKIDLKTMIYIGSILVSGITMYFTFMSELDSRFGELEGTDNTVMVELDKRLTTMETSVDKRLTELENKFTPIGDGVYTVDPNSTWPPSRGEYKMKDEMSRNKILVLKKEIEELKEDIEKIEKELENNIVDDTKYFRDYKNMLDNCEIDVLFVCLS